MKSVFIDPGHGGSDSGAVGVNKTLEKDITLSVSKKVETLLKPCGIKVYMSRANNSTITLSQRTSKANNAGVDCFVSIHCNAFNNKAKGVETYSHKATTNDLATDIHNEILKSKAYTLNRGVKTANFQVLRDTKMRACLIELAFIDSKEDNDLLMNKQDELSIAIAKGICKHLGVAFKEEVQPPVNTSPDGVYQVICGSYGDKQNAINMQRELEEKGFDSFLHFKREEKK